MSDFNEVKVRRAGVFQVFCYMFSFLLLVALLVDGFEKLSQLSAVLIFAIGLLFVPRLFEDEVYVSGPVYDPEQLKKAGEKDPSLRVYFWHLHEQEIRRMAEEQKPSMFERVLACIKFVFVSLMVICFLFTAWGAYAYFYKGKDVFFFEKRPVEKYVSHPCTFAQHQMIREFERIVGKTSKGFKKPYLKAEFLAKLFRKRYRNLKLNGKVCSTKDFSGSNTGPPAKLEKPLLISADKKKSAQDGLW